MPIYNFGIMGMPLMKLEGNFYMISARQMMLYGLEYWAT